jgi:hypothetical protein
VKLSRPALLFSLLLTLGFHLGLEAATPSWQSFGMFIEGIGSQKEADKIMRAIETVDPEHVRAASKLTPKVGFVLVEHDHHNIRYQILADAVHQLGSYRISVPMLMPDYQRIQGTLLAKGLNEVWAKKTPEFQVRLVDAKTGRFDIILPPGDHQKSGFNFGDLAHPISDPIVFGGLGLPMSYPGHEGQGGMTKDPILKEAQFRKAGKKEKPYDPKLMAAHRKLFP